MDYIPDDELISFMKRHFDGKCQGSLEYLSGTSLEELCRNTRYGYKLEAADLYDYSAEYETEDTDMYGNPF